MVRTKNGITEAEGTFSELMSDVIQIISTVAITLESDPDAVIEAVTEWYRFIEQAEGPDGWKEGYKDAEEEDIQEERSREKVADPMQGRIWARGSRYRRG